MPECCEKAVDNIDSFEWLHCTCYLSFAPLDLLLRFSSYLVTLWVMSLGSVALSFLGAGKQSMANAGRKWEIGKHDQRNRSLDFFSEGSPQTGSFYLKGGPDSALSSAASNQYCFLPPLLGLEMSKLPIHSNPVTLHCSLRFTYTLRFVYACACVGGERERWDRDIQEELKIDKGTQADFRNQSS